MFSPLWKLAALLWLATDPLHVSAAHFRRATGPAVEDSYIVVLKKGCNLAGHIASISDTFSAQDTSNVMVVKHEYSKAITGYSAILKGATMDRILSDPNVEYIVPDHIATVNYKVSEPPKRGLVDAFGNIHARATNGTDGEGVDVYGIDSGIYLEHADFGGRARWGATFGGLNSTDDNGHGTHTASIAVGAQYGIAKAANVIAVKVLGPDGTAAYSNIIAGLEWVMDSAAASGRPSVANLSLGGPRDSTLDDAVKSTIASGVHVTVSSGNSGVDASGSSPAGVEEANTVGAADRDNKSAGFSNTGPVVDVYGLGVDVTAAWITGPNSVQALSGTSMSAPRVAGILAVALSKRGKTPPAELSAALLQNAQHLVTGQPSNTTDLLAEMFS
ncbi:subtilisin-like serine protease [Serendipita sp. 401]|nr:subtilisin-like serine protease [Serendipita sp. 401]